MEDAEKEFNERMYEYLVDVLINKNPYTAKIIISELHERMAMSENKKIKSMRLSFGRLNENYEEAEGLTYAAYNSLFNKTVIDEKLLFESVKNGEFIKVLDSFGHESTHAAQASREKTEGKREFKLDAETLLASMILFPEVQKEFIKEGISIEKIAYFNYFSEKDEIEARDKGGEFAKSFLTAFKAYGNEELNQIIDRQIKLHRDKAIYRNFEQLKAGSLVKTIRDNIKDLENRVYLDGDEPLNMQGNGRETLPPVAASLLKDIKNKVVEFVKQSSVSPEMADKVLGRFPFDSFLANVVNIHEDIDTETVIRLMGFQKYAELAEEGKIAIKKEEDLKELLETGFLPKGTVLSKKQKIFFTDNFLFLSYRSQHNFLEEHCDEKKLKVISKQVENSGYTKHGFNNDNSGFLRGIETLLMPYENKEEKRKNKRNILLKGLYETHEKIEKGLVYGFRCSEDSEKGQIYKQLNEQYEKDQTKLRGFGGVGDEFALRVSAYMEIGALKGEHDEEKTPKHKNKLMLHKHNSKPKEEIKE